MPRLSATTKSAAAPDIEGGLTPGLYDIRFTGLETKFIEGGQYGDGDRYVWSGVLLDDDGKELLNSNDESEDFMKPVYVDGLTSMSLNTQSKTTPKAVRFIKALATAEEFEDFVDGEGIDTDAFVGRKVQADIIIRDNGWPSIVNILPARKARRSSTASA